MGNGEGKMKREKGKEERRKVKGEKGKGKREKGEGIRGKWTREKGTGKREMENGEVKRKTSFADHAAGKPVF